VTFTDSIEQLDARGKQDSLKNENSNASAYQTG
jgi:hypothetical protein